MSNYPRFIVAHSDYKGKDKVFLVCTRKPFFIAEILIFNTTSEYKAYLLQPVKEHRINVAGTTAPVSTFIPVRSHVYGVFVLEFLQDPGQRENIIGLMDRLRDWLINYYKDKTFEKYE